MPFELTDTELKYLLGALNCLDGEMPKLNVNFNKLAEHMGITNPKSAQNGWHKVWKKIANNAAGTESSTKKTPVKANAKVNAKEKAKGRAKGKGKNVVDDENDDVLKGGELLLKLASSSNIENTDDDTTSADDNPATITKSKDKGKAMQVLPYDEQDTEGEAPPTVKKSTRKTPKAKVDLTNIILYTKPRSSLRSKAKIVEEEPLAAPSPPKRTRSSSSTKVDDDGAPLSVKRTRRTASKATVNAKAPEAVATDDAPSMDDEQKRLEEEAVNEEVLSLLEGRKTSPVGGEEEEVEGPTLGEVLFAQAKEAAIADGSTSTSATTSANASTSASSSDGPAVGEAGPSSAATTTGAGTTTSETLNEDETTLTEEEEA